MEKREEIKEAVKNEVIKLMALELKQEDTFKQLQRELSEELFKLSPSETKDNISSGPINQEIPKEEKPKILRTLNENWGYDPINKNEEKTKRMLGFLYNPKNLGKGFIGDEITPEEEEFMKNSIFTKNSMIEELEAKLKELKKEVRNYQSKNAIDSKVEILKDFEKAESKIVDKSSAQKLADFKKEFYGDEVKRNITDSLRRTVDFSKTYEEMIAPEPIKEAAIETSFNKNAEEFSATQNPVVEAPSDESVKNTESIRITKKKSKKSIGKKAKRSK